MRFLLRDRTPNCRYRFIGRIWYKALHEGTLVDVVFADFFLAKWLGKQSVLDHLASTRLEPEPYIHEALTRESLSLSPSLKMARSCAEPSVSALNICSEFGVAQNGCKHPCRQDDKLQYTLRASQSKSNSRATHFSTAYRI
ncbi:hypothetical protein EDB89DRAFT_379802 [Lactarius sanguifluus]|nr:hypothetical protein EDB89DRAFT_379802 [Lactarius sanguifluus]